MKNLTKTLIAGRIPAYAFALALMLGTAVTSGAMAQDHNGYEGPSTPASASQLYHGEVVHDVDDGA